MYVRVRVRLRVRVRVRVRARCVVYVSGVVMAFTQHMYVHARGATGRHALQRGSSSSIPGVHPRQLSGTETGNGVEGEGGEGERGGSMGPCRDAAGPRTPICTRARS